MTDTREQDPRVDELRQRLRSLGYLDAGVDRFVLAPAHGRRGPAALALLASLRIGALGALLLGPATAIGVGGRASGLVTGPRDALVIAVYSGILMGAAIAIAAFAASLAVAWLTRRASTAIAGRARGIALLAGALVALLTLVYLTLWWQTASAGLGWASPMWTAFALAVAAAISVLLGHAVTVTALAVIAAGTGPPPTIRGVPGASWRVSLAAAALAFCGAAALLVFSAPAESRPAAPPDLTVVSSGLRVRVIGIDGFDPTIFSKLAAAGRVPALAAVLLKPQATLRADASDTVPGAPQDPARAWTTMATGQPAAVHGVRGLETRRVAGVQGAVAASTPSTLLRSLRGATDLLRLTRPAIASGSERNAKTFWEIAVNAGLRTAVVNWWASWPAPPDTGIVLSDRATLRLERGGELDAEIAPADLYASLGRRWIGLRETAVASAKASLASAPAGTPEASLLARSAELDAIQLTLAREVSPPNLDLLAVYLPGLDIVQHTLLDPDEGTPASASSLAARLSAIEAYYEALDRMLVDWLRPGGGEAVMILTGPGRVRADTPGTLGAVGGFVRRGANTDGRLTDVAPTILHALGIPISDELQGRPLNGLFDEEFLRRYPARSVPTYGRPSAPAPQRAGKPLDQEMIDRLRSLGYVR